MLFAAFRHLAVNRNHGVMHAKICLKNVKWLALSAPRIFIALYCIIATRNIGHSCKEREKLSVLSA